MYERRVNLKKKKKKDLFFGTGSQNKGDDSQFLSHSALQSEGFIC